MKNLLIDTNIVIDLLAKRDPFYQESALLFSLADKGLINLSVSALTFANTHYILSRQISAGEAKNILRRFNLLVSILSLDEKVIKLSLNDDSFTDYEDAIQYFSALENKQDMIITRNLKDFKNSDLPVMTARQFLEIFRQP